MDVESNNGGTEFCLGSHFHTKHWGEDIVWQDSSWRERISFDGEVLAIKVSSLVFNRLHLIFRQVNAGEVLAFDYRVLHRALEHGGREVRPLLYYTFTKRWFADAMNFAALPSLREADARLAASAAEWRTRFPSLKEPGRIFCDGAAGSQVPDIVIKSMTEHLASFGATNVGGSYPGGQAVLDLVGRARASAATLLGARSSGEIAFGQNCSNLLFHLAAALKNSSVCGPGDNILLSPACHEANIAPWLALARQTGTEVRWLDLVDTQDPAQMDQINTHTIHQLVDQRTRLICLGLASNATGRIHNEAVEAVRSARQGQTDPAFLVLDATHYVPHCLPDFAQMEADALVCSAYKFFGPHLGIMAFDQSRFSQLTPSKASFTEIDLNFFTRTLTSAADAFR